MKVTLALSLIAVFLLQSAVTLDCPKGYYDPGSGATKCNRCDKVFTECTAPLVGTVNSRIVGYKVVGSSPSPYCAQYSGVWSYYNKEDNNCHVICKLGCDKCNTDYDFCTDCSAGFTWNPDYTCLPAVIGL
jgi:hypothetical protein